MGVSVRGTNETKEGEGGGERGGERRGEGRGEGGGERGRSCTSRSPRSEFSVKIKSILGMTTGWFEWRYNLSFPEFLLLVTGEQ